MAPPRLTRNSAGSREGTEQNDYHDDRRGSDDDDDLFGEEGGPDDEEGGSGSSDSDSGKEEDTVVKPKPKKKVVIDDKDKKKSTPKGIDPVVKDNAQKAVRFNEEHYNGFCPDEECSRGKSTVLRRKSLYHMHHQLKSPDEVLAEAVADADDEPKLTFDLFNQYISTEVQDTKTFDVRLTHHEVTKDLKQKMEEFAELFIQDSVPSVPFRPLLPSDLPFSGYLTEEKFAELCRGAPKAMFQEFKLLSIMSMARKEQVTELHRLVSHLNVKLKTIHDWVPALAKHYGAADPKMVQSLKDHLADKEDEIQTLKETIADLSVLKGIRKPKDKGTTKETILPSIERDP
ncbi:hypothetical protein N0V85_006808, partial [Neurospora sp. IMI 360204]